MNQKAQTMIESHRGEKKINEGDMVICIQGNKEKVDAAGSGPSEMILVNMDWSFREGATAEDVKSMLGGFLSSIEDLFGEKMVTEAVVHYADEMNHMIDTPNGRGMYLKSKGLTFKDWTR